MTTQFNNAEVTSMVSLLSKAKQEMIRMSGHCADTAGDWDRAQQFLQWAKQLDIMIKELGQEGRLASDRAPVALQPPTSTKLPFHCIEDDKLVKVGRSRDGGTYEHRVTRRNYDLILHELSQMAGTANSFETQDLVNRCNIPRHEPLIVLAVLEEQRLLEGIRRGRWRFTNDRTFSADAAHVWPALPRR